MRIDHGTIEYEFTLPDGSKRFEIVVERGDIHHFMKMHGAVKARPVQDFPRSPERSSQ